MRKKFVIFVILMTSGCASTNIPKTSVTSNWMESDGLILIDPIYNGTFFFARLLVRGDPPILIDPRFIPYVHVDIQGIENCFGEPIDYWRPSESASVPLENSKTFLIEPNFIFGKNVEFQIFPPINGEPLPCIQLTIGVRDESLHEEGVAVYRWGKFRLFRKFGCCYGDGERSWEKLQKARK